MDQISPTRTELLAKKAQISLAERGRDLLKQKRDALLREFMPLIDETLRLSERLERTVAEAQFSLAIAEAIDGIVAVRSASMATEGEITIDITGQNVMGVPLPLITKGKSAIRKITKRGYALTGVSGRIDETAEKFEKILDAIVESAGIETRLRRLGEELQKTNRRVNALDYLIIPKIKQQINYVKLTLDERAREDLFRLKKVKSMLVRRRK